MKCRRHPSKPPRYHMDPYWQIHANRPTSPRFESRWAKHCEVGHPWSIAIDHRERSCHLCSSACLCPTAVFEGWQRPGSKKGLCLISCAGRRRSCCDGGQRCYQHHALLWSYAGWTFADCNWSLCRLKDKPKGSGNLISHHWQWLRIEMDWTQHCPEGQWCFSHGATWSTQCYRWCWWRDCCRKGDWTPSFWIEARGQIQMHSWVAKSWDHKFKPSCFNSSIFKYCIPFYPQNPCLSMFIGSYRSIFSKKCSLREVWHFCVQQSAGIIDQRFATAPARP